MIGPHPLVATRRSRFREPHSHSPLTGPSEHMCCRSAPPQIRESERPTAARIESTSLDSLPFDVSNPGDRHPPSILRPEGPRRSAAHPLPGFLTLSAAFSHLDPVTLFHATSVLRLLSGLQSLSHSNQPHRLSAAVALLPSPDAGPCVGELPQHTSQRRPRLQSFAPAERPTLRGRV